MISLISEGRLDATPDPESDLLLGDFDRDVRCLFGLPVDNHTMASTKALLRKRARLPGSTVVSTVNVNWVVQALTDPQFRKSIRNSDIVILDGKPLLWIAKSLGYPMKEVVPGSSLISELRRDQAGSTQLSIFFFGGNESVADRAQDRLNSSPGALRAVGAFNPGYGTIEEMSTDVVLTRINTANPDILLVALGAHKGTAWIETNRQRLNAKIISHLGATINFLAGTVKRAPKVFRSLGIEWIWRILQEPRLFPRYASDGVFLVRLLAGRFSSWLYYKRLNRKFAASESQAILHQRIEPDRVILTIGRNAQASKCPTARDVFRNAAKLSTNITLDFQDTQFVDASFMGLLFLLLKHQNQNKVSLDFINVSPSLHKLLRLYCVDAELLHKHP